jgi:serine/threonine-protein kinase HipA
MATDGIFLDSSPDRWGQTLMDRREALQASDEERRPHPLQAWDYLIGVQDLTRQGALRFRFPRTETFLDAQLRAAPPVTTLPELPAVALELTRQHIDNLDHLRGWLAVLVAPGASLGGARPKANFVDTDGSLWIGKFPSRTDTRGVAAWETLTHTLARRADVDVPEARLARLGSDYHTFCVRRFDREHGARVFFASALTMTGRQQSEGASYLDLALFPTPRRD